MSLDEIVTQPVPVHVRAALDALMAISGADQDLESGFRASMAQAVLLSGRPLYPPLLRPAEVIPAGRAVELAAMALELAVDEASSVEEALRCGTAAAALQGRPPIDVAW